MDKSEMNQRMKGRNNTGIGKKIINAAWDSKFLRPVPLKKGIVLQSQQHNQNNTTSLINKFKKDKK